MYETVLNISDLCEKFIDHVEEVGHECEYTDELAEQIYDEADSLHKRDMFDYSDVDMIALEEAITRETKPLVLEMNARIRRLVREAKNKSSDEGKN